MRGGKATIFLWFGFVLAHANVAHGAEPNCPDYWRNSTLVSEVYVRIPLEFEPPNKQQFLSLSLPKLDSGVEAHAYEIENKTLKMIFCGLKPDAFSVDKVLAVTVGPNKIEIPPSQLSIDRSSANKTRRLVGTGLKPLAMDWISPIGISFLSADKTKVALTVSFAAPHRKALDVGLLRIRLLSEHSRCRGRREIQESNRMKINARATVTLDGSYDAKTYAAAFYPAGRCGPPAVLKIEFGPYKHSMAADIQTITIRIMNVEFEPISAAQWKKQCSGLERRSDVRQCLDDSLGEPKFSIGPTEEVVIEAEPSNIFPKTFRVWHQQ